VDDEDDGDADAEQKECHEVDAPHPHDA
jgi:hypothetical protein